LICLAPAAWWLAAYPRGMVAAYYEMQVFGFPDDWEPDFDLAYDLAGSV
jgi:hypothetical protein